MDHRNPLARGAVALALSLAVVACGSDDDTAAPSDEEVQAPAGDEVAAESDADAEDAPTIEVVAVDYAFDGLPESTEAGTRLTLRNDASTELHELVAFRLADDEERSVEEIVGLPPEEMEAALGAPTTVILAPPSSGQVATPIGDGTLDEPGRYALICLIPTGVDPEEYMEAAATSDGPPDVGDGAPHIAHGMFAELEVR